MTRMIGTDNAGEPLDPVALNDMSLLFRNIASLTGAQDPDGRWVFRGVSDYEYELIPSVGRHPAVGGSYEVACALEEWLFSRFRRRALVDLGIAELMSIRDACAEVDRFAAQFSGQGGGETSLGEQWVWTALMQHFGVPTRFLDWSESPWVALYFACAEDHDRHGSVYILDKVKLTKELDDRLATPVKLFPRQGTPSKDAIQVIDVPHAFRRVANQLGLFTVTDNPCEDHRELLRGRLRGSQAFRKWRIPSHVKRPMLGQLRRMGITPHAVFPGLGGLAQTIRDELSAL